MAGVKGVASPGAFAGANTLVSHNYGYNAQFTWTVFGAALLASSGGALFGWDNGVMGGVIGMDGFLKKFLPSVYDSQHNYVTSSSLYCSYDNQILSLLTSVLFLAGTICEGSGTTAYLSRYHGRKRVMLYSGICFMLAAVIMCAAFNISQIIIGRVLQGVAISFASVSVPIYNSEIAPPQHRGLMNILYQIILTLFIFFAQLLNLVLNVVHSTRWGWRLSLGAAFIPSFTLFIAGIVLPDSANSLLERGYPEKARRSLEIMRGTKDVDKEFNDLVEAAELAASVKHPWRNMFSYKYRPQLFLATMSTLAQQWTGINIIIFYGPQIFTAFGASNTLALVTSLILGACNHLSTYVAWWTADKIGRRPLFIQAGFQMATALIAITIVLAVVKNGVAATNTSEKPGLWEAWLILGLLCLFDMAYAWSWGPLGWLYPTEISPLDIRSCGLAVASFNNLLFSFVIAQCFLRMLCSMREYIFLFFAACVIVETIIVWLTFIETKGVPIEESPFTFKTHRIWRKYACSSIGWQEKLVVERRIRVAEETGQPLQMRPGMEDVRQAVLHELATYGRLLKPDDDPQALAASYANNPKGMSSPADENMKPY